MIKRIIDIILALLVCIVFLGPLLVVCAVIFVHDRRSPFYVAKRVGKHGKLFRMFKLRTMTVNADQSGLVSTSDTDLRITSIGKRIRKLKLDEIPQFLNVLIGDMSVVGPRPNVQVEVSIYTAAEELLLSVKPGITDLASIVFSDEGEILATKSDADEGYNKFIRPYKSRLALAYINNTSIRDDLYIICATARNIFDRAGALKMIERLALKFDIEERCLKVVRRNIPLEEWTAP